MSHILAGFADVTLRITTMQGQASLGATNKQQAGAAARPGGASGDGGMTIAEQAAQMAARRGKPPAAPGMVTQSSSMVCSCHDQLQQL